MVFHYSGCTRNLHMALILKKKPLYTKRQTIKKYKERHSFFFHVKISSLQDVKFLFTELIKGEFVHYLDKDLVGHYQSWLLW